MSYMKNSLRFITLSKYPPYRSGHAKQALWNNTALAALTGVEQHQVTYCGVSSDPEDYAGPGINVHHVKEVPGNRRVPDGHLLRAVAGELHRGFDRAIGVAAGGQEDMVGAASAGNRCEPAYQRIQVAG